MAINIQEQIYVPGKSVDNRFSIPNATQIGQLENAYVGMIVYCTAHDADNEVPYYRVTEINAFNQPTKWEKLFDTASRLKAPVNKQNAASDEVVMGQDGRFVNILYDPLSGIAGQVLTKTINGTKWASPGDVSIYEKVTHKELTDMMQSSKLAPGKMYVITDYSCETSLPHTKSAGKNFNIIVEAVDANQLSENAWAADVEGNFNSDIDSIRAWDIKYCIDNNSTRFKWAPLDYFEPNDIETLRVTSPGNAFNQFYENGGAFIHNSDLDTAQYKAFVLCDGSDLSSMYVTNDSYAYVIRIRKTYSVGFDMFVQVYVRDLDNGTEQTWHTSGTNVIKINEQNKGKGVVYYMRDDMGNEAPYDFKNIMFERHYVDNVDFTGCVAPIAGYSPIDNNITINSNYSEDVQTQTKWCYTFSYVNKGSDTIMDMTENQHSNDRVTYEQMRCSNNVIKPAYVYDYDKVPVMTLNNIVFYTVRDSSTSATDTFECEVCDNVMLGQCHDMTLAGRSTNNIFGSGSSMISSNTAMENCKFGDSCESVNILSELNAVSFDASVKNITVVSSDGTSEIENVKILSGDYNSEIIALKKLIASGAQYVGLSSVGDHVQWIPADGVMLRKGNSLVIGTTWKQLHDNTESGNLIPGASYRITDYECVTAQSDTQSAGHQFDIIVQAVDESTLSEDAKAAIHDGDAYFSDCDLSAWKLKYNINNDSGKYSWVRPDSVEITSVTTFRADLETLPEAVSQNITDNSAEDTWAFYNDDTYDPEAGYTKYYLSYDAGSTFDRDYCFKFADDVNLTFDQEITTVDESVTTTVKVINGKTRGKGVVYEMIDENNNRCGYDFKNIMFARNPITNASVFEDVPAGIPAGTSTVLSGYTAGNKAYYYTFSCTVEGEETDATIDTDCAVRNNYIGDLFDETHYYLNNIVFASEDGIPAAVLNNRMLNVSESTFPWACSFNNIMFASQLHAIDIFSGNEIRYCSNALFVEKAYMNRIDTINSNFVCNGHFEQNVLTGDCYSMSMNDVNKCVFNNVAGCELNVSVSKCKFDNVSVCSFDEMSDTTDPDYTTSIDGVTFVNMNNCGKHIPVHVSYENKTMSVNSDGDIVCLNIADLASASDEPGDTSSYSGSSFTSLSKANFLI